MPPLPTITNVFRCALDWNNATGQHATNVVHFETTAGGRTAQQVFNCLDAHVVAGMWNAVGGTSTIFQVEITPLDGISSKVTFTTSGAAKWQGGGGADYVPQQSPIIKLATGLRGPRHRGRIYLPFAAEAQQVNGAIVAGTVAAMQTAWDAFLVATQGDATTPMNLVVASYAHADANLVSKLTVETETATQKRRQNRNR